MYCIEEQPLKFESPSRVTPKTCIIIIFFSSDCLNLCPFYLPSLHLPPPHIHHSTTLRNISTLFPTLPDTRANCPFPSTIVVVDRFRTLGVGYLLPHVSKAVQVTSTAPARSCLPRQMMSVTIATSGSIFMLYELLGQANGERDRNQAVQDARGASSMVAHGACTSALHATAL